MTRKVVVAHLIPRIPFGGGAETLLLDICRSIDRERFSMVVFYWTGDEGLALSLREAGAVVVRLPLNKRAPFLSAGALVKAVKEYRVDILHTHFMDSDLLGFLSGWFTGVPMIMHVHSFPFPQTRVHALRYKFMSMGIKKIVCVSAYVERFVASLTGIKRKKFVVVSNGTDHDRFTDRFSSQEKADLKRSLGLFPAMVVGSVTRLEPDKSVETLLQSIPVVLEQYPQVRFLIVGDGTCRIRLEKLTQELGIEKAVVFAGSRQDIPMLLSIMDIFVITAVEEAFGLSLLEAMAAGRPVAAANACALPELVRDGQEGVLFRPGDAESLADALLRLLDDAGLASHLAAQGALRSMEFTSRAMAGRLEKVYDEVLKRD
jgi:glycosyltransferase involved in cell wall biosynthesis